MPSVDHADIGTASKPRKPSQQPLQAAQLAEALLRLSTVVAITGLSRSSIYARLAASQFPQPIRLGARCTRFRAADVQAWLAAQGR